MCASAQTRPAIRGILPVVTVRTQRFHSRRIHARVIGSLDITASFSSLQERPSCPSINAGSGGLTSLI